MYRGEKTAEFCDRRGLVPESKKKRPYNPVRAAGSCGGRLSESEAASCPAQARRNAPCCSPPRVTHLEHKAVCTQLRGVKRHRCLPDSPSLAPRQLLQAQTRLTQSSDAGRGGSHAPSAQEGPH